MTARLAASVILLVLLAGGIWQPHDPDHVDMLLRHRPPSWAHPLGTDHLGRDLASRMLAGGWRTAIVVAAVGTIGFLCGGLIGTAAAILGGWRERVILRAVEMFIVVPTLIWALTAAAIFGLTPVTAGIALGLAGVGPYALLANSLTRRTLRQPYVAAARALGAGNAGVMRRHVLPNTLPVIFTYAGSQSGQSVIAYASLAFIGLGADPSKPDWGGMLHEYRMFIFDDPRLMFAPGLAIAFMTAVLNLSFDRSGGSPDSLPERPPPKA